jgi:uncharacterized protein (TIGR03086 family)
MIDLGPAADRVAALLTHVDDAALEGRTPCPGTKVGDLVDHIGSLTLGFTASAAKQRDTAGGPPPRPSAANLGPDWRERIPRDLGALAAAWRDPSAWEGSTTAGGMTFPAEVVGVVALDELVVHGWDLAVSTNQPYEPTEDDVHAAIAFASSFEAPRDGSLFGPVVPVPDDAPPLDRLLGLTGRDPHWKP